MLKKIEVFGGPYYTNLRFSLYRQQDIPNSEDDYCLFSCLIS